MDEGALRKDAENWRLAYIVANANVTRLEAELEEERARREEMAKTIAEVSEILAAIRRSA
jgi:hypothetical protein